MWTLTFLPARRLGVEGLRDGILIDRRDEVVADEIGNPGVGNASQNKDEVLESRFAKLDRFAEHSGCKIPDAAVISHVKGRHNKPMTISVGLCRIHDFHIRPDVLADSLNIALDLAQIDRNGRVGVFNGLRHNNPPF